MIDRNTEKTLFKFKALREQYLGLLYRNVAVLSCDICEIKAPENTPEQREKFQYAIPNQGWEPISRGQTWGGAFSYAWFRCNYTVQETDKNKKLLLLPNTGAPESLLYLNGKPRGLFDICYDETLGNSPREHGVQPLTLDARPGQSFEILLECYAGHFLPGNHPWESIHNQEYPFYPRDPQNRTFTEIAVVEPDMAVAEFLKQHTLICQLLEICDEDSLAYGQLMQVVQEVFRVLPQFPQEKKRDFHPPLCRAVEILSRITKDQPENKLPIGYIGLIGHSHLDTAWHWPVRETLHKAARTFSNALTLMEHYPDYRFMQSSVLYLHWMKQYYPDIYADIKKRTAEKRWEPNGGAWVEFDNNIPGGEFIIRQFLRGQRYTKENLGYMADCFWEPDTFGYSAALPQILKGCGIRYFLTTKLAWNEANQFPYDSFLWKGIDGTQVLTHFNLAHLGADPKALDSAVEAIRHKDVTDMKLIAYGYGDGGGGPSFRMEEYAQQTKSVPWVPKTEVTTVSGFMQRLEQTAKELPVYAGELYLELHRGTLTQMHHIKRSNRLLEKSIRHLEFLNVLRGQKDGAVLKEAIDTLLINQFHDILPGTCIEDAHETAIFQNYRAVRQLAGEAERLMARTDDRSLTLVNTLSWERDGQITVDDTGFAPTDCVVQRYQDLEGKPKLAFLGISLQPLSETSASAGVARVATVPFSVEGDIITTPFATVTLQNGCIKSYLCRDGHQAVRDPAKPWNTLYCGEDIPLSWDNWDIDYDQKYKMQPVLQTVSQEVVSVGPLQLRIRVVKRFGEASTISQDIVFYADTPRIDFETVVDWQEVHTLLKAGFDVNVLSRTARFETQFGYVERVTHENYGTDKTQFEVCNHKWTDLSDSRFGVALLNDCKYGISVKESDMRLTLHKGGCHPDGRGDQGIHSFTYAVLVHECGFSTESVIRPAYELNYPVACYPGGKAVSENGLLQLDCGNVIVETVKNAEDGDGMILRLYEAEGTHANATLKFGIPVACAAETDMLEYKKADLTVTDGVLALTFRPFEIKTVKIYGAHSGTQPDMTFTVKTPAGAREE